MAYLAHLAHCRAFITELPMSVVNQVGPSAFGIMDYYTKINVFGGMQDMMVQLIQNVERRFPKAKERIIGKLDH